MHCNLRQPDAAQSLSALISLHMSSSKSLSLSVAVLERFYCWYVTLYSTLWPLTLDLWPWRLTIDLEHLYYTGGAMLCTKSERNRAIRGGVIASWIFDLMTLNMNHVLRYQSMVSFCSMHKCWTVQWEANTNTKYTWNTKYRKIRQQCY